MRERRGEREGEIEEKGDIEEWEREKKREQ